MEFTHFFELVLVMFDLAEIKESSALLTWLCFLFLFYIFEYGLLVGKNLYARVSKDNYWRPWFAYIIFFEYLKSYILSPIIQW